MTRMVVWLESARTGRLTAFVGCVCFVVCNKLVMQTCSPQALLVLDTQVFRGGDEKESAERRQQPRGWGWL